MSLTITSILGLIISHIVGDSVDQASIANFINVGGMIIFGLLGWYARWSKGDITWYGTKK